MVKFRKLVKKARPVDAKDLVALFESRDRHTSHTELRPAQRQALEALTDRRTERDLILKVSTGAGKTAVGLVYLQSHMQQRREPTVYLCPTVQLVEQVREEASRNGLSTVDYPRGMSIPPVDGTTGNAIILCTYDKLFNGRSTFDRPDVQLRPCAMLLDDAHTGVDKIRDKFRLSYAASNSECEALLDLLEPACSKQYPGKWTDIRNQDIHASMEVPYWTWASVLREVARIVSSPEEGQDNWFAWPLVRDVLRWCRCIVSGAGLEIVPLVLPVDSCRAFDGCPNRLFMSATLADDAALVRDLGCAAAAVASPIRPSADKGLGERMVLTPSLIDRSLNRDWLASTCKKLSRKVNVVVLSPSELAAKTWKEAGAEFVMGDEVAAVVRRLREEKTGNFVVFAQRYDGVDLPDEACRVLVLDGLPSGESITDAYDSSLSDSLRRRIVHRIEQGMGRAVRSHVDYAVIVLAGPNLANFIARSQVLSAMNPDTRAQLQLAIDLAKLAMEEDESPEDAFISMVQQCLGRDSGWKDYYQENVREVEQAPAATVGRESLPMAVALRESFKCATGKDVPRAADVLACAADSNVTDQKDRAPFLQIVANYMHEFDPGKALEIQRSAYNSDRSLFCPPMVAKRPHRHSGIRAPEVILRWFHQFENPNGAIAAIHDLRARMSYDANPKIVEQALLELAPLVGADGFRPEEDLGEGPDALWLWPELSVVIEAKNQNEKSLHKKDAGQLLISLQWFKHAYPTRGDPLPVVVTKKAVADKLSDFPDNTRVLTPTGLGTLLDNVEVLYGRMLHTPLMMAEATSIASVLEELGLAANQFRSKYTSRLH
ncbi:DEAD/DEAH box helicase family protein [Acidobacteria bacterium AH-259-A15]|nr:DEAD/DEAH box helicase family protein [Acidobacteria bacterium AH-259-A15]